VRVAVIYNFGVNRGSGDFVMLNVLEALDSVSYKISSLTSTRIGARVYC